MHAPGMGTKGTAVVTCKMTHQILGHTGDWKSEFGCNTGVLYGTRHLACQTPSMSCHFPGTKRYVLLLLLCSLEPSSITGLIAGTWYLIPGTYRV